MLLLIFAILYLFTAKGHLEVSDTSFSVQTAEALITRGSFDIPGEVGGATFRALNGKSYSKYGIGLPILYLPIVGLSELLGPAIGRPAVEISGFVISFLNIPFTLLTITLFGYLLGRIGASPEYARLLMTGLALGTLCWRYAVYDFSEGIQTAFLLLAVAGAFSRHNNYLLISGLGFSGLICVKLVHIALFPIFVFYLILQAQEGWHSRLKAVSFFSTPVLLAISVIAWLNVVRFGNPFESGYGEEARRFIVTQLPYTIPRLLGSLDKGLFLFCPVLIIGLVGWFPFIRRFPREASLCTGLVLANLMLAGAWHSWVGGWSWGPRLLVPAIPLWLLPAGCAFSGTPSRRTRWWIACLTFVSVLFQIPGIVVKGQQIHHIRYNLLTDKERDEFPPDWPAAWLVLKHKFRTDSEIYTLAELGVPGERTINVTQYRTYHGLNVWTEHVARQFRIPLLRWLPIFGFATICLLGFRIMKAAKAEKACKQ